MSQDKQTILDKAKHIVYESGRDQDYGEPGQSFPRIAIVASILTRKHLTPRDIAFVQIATKLVRESYTHKQDNTIDACGYTSLLEDVTGIKDIDILELLKQQCQNNADAPNVGRH